MAWRSAVGREPYGLRGLARPLTECPEEGTRLFEADQERDLRIGRGRVGDVMPRAASDSLAKGGDYFGPKGFYEMRGYPIRVGTTPAARNGLDARRLWEVSEKLTGVSFESLKTNAA